MENQAAQLERYQQRKQEVEEHVRKNEDLLRRAHTELKKTQVENKPFNFVSVKCLVYSEPFGDHLLLPSSSSVVVQGMSRKLQLELTELQNTEEPQSEDLKPLVGGAARENPENPREQSRSPCWSHTGLLKWGYPLCTPRGTLEDWL